MRATPRRADGGSNDRTGVGRSCPEAKSAVRITGTFDLMTRGVIAAQIFYVSIRSSPCLCLRGLQFFQKLRTNSPSRYGDTEEKAWIFFHHFAAEALCVRRGPNKTTLNFPQLEKRFTIL